jgi:glucose-1-phosphate cytidylyltransferase
MKVVLLAGGLGTRMREETEFRPKPMVEVGGKPVLWHIMKIYANYGHTDFVICAGYKGDQIKQYFYNYAASNMDFTVKLGDQDSAVFHGSHDEFGWTVTVADTGPETPTGGRLHRVGRYLDGEAFFCTYGDGLADVNLDMLWNTHQNSQGLATVTVAKPEGRFGVVDVGSNGKVEQFLEKPAVADPVSIGYFVFDAEVLSFLDDDSVLEQEPLRALAAGNNLTAFEHSGFWQPMDTQREYQRLNELWASGMAPWKIWV